VNHARLAPDRNRELPYKVALAIRSARGPSHSARAKPFQVGPEPAAYAGDVGDPASFGGIVEVSKVIRYIARSSRGRAAKGRDGGEGEDGKARELHLEA
jgi:hypothetical protein